MNYRKVGAGLLTLSMLASLTACGTKEVSKETNKQTQQAQKQQERRFEQTPYFFGDKEIDITKPLGSGEQVDISLLDVAERAIDMKETGLATFDVYNYESDNLYHMLTHFVKVKRDGGYILAVGNINGKDFNKVNMVRVMYPNGFNGNINEIVSKDLNSLLGTNEKFDVTKDTITIQGKEFKISKNTANPSDNMNVRVFIYKEDTAKINEETEKYMFDNLINRGKIQKFGLTVKDFNKIGSKINNPTGYYIVNEKALAGEGTGNTTFASIETLDGSVAINVGPYGEMNILISSNVVKDEVKLTEIINNIFDSKVKVEDVKKALADKNNEGTIEINGVTYNLRRVSEEQGYDSVYYTIH